MTEEELKKMAVAYDPRIRRLVAEVRRQAKEIKKLRSINKKLIKEIDNEIEDNEKILCRTCHSIVWNEDAVWACHDGDPRSPTGDLYEPHTCMECWSKNEDH